jgi:hypothetical protein
MHAEPDTKATTVQARRDPRQWVYLVQPFLTAARFDLSARLCVIAFSVAIPLLAALVVINRQRPSVVA